jgi:erythromycin esterase-like protein
MGSSGELNLGQLARERLGDRAFLIGFTTHTGTVAAAREWDEPSGVVLATSASRDALAEARLKRAIGVIYDTTSALTPLERWSRENSDLPETYPTGV